MTYTSLPLLDGDELLSEWNITMALPVGTATVEHPFSQMKLSKILLRSCLSDSNLEHLMKISIEGPPLTDVDSILDIFKQKNRRILL